MDPVGVPGFGDGILVTLRTSGICRGDQPLEVHQDGTMDNAGAARSHPIGALVSLPDP